MRGWRGCSSKGCEGRVFSGEVDTGSREENASNKNLEPRSDSIGTENALVRDDALSPSMPCPDPDRRLVRYADAVPDKHRQQRDRDADQRGPDEEPDEAGTLDHEAREAGQNAARKGAERGQE